MPCQGRVFHKGFGTKIALKWPFFFVSSYVSCHQTLLGGSVGAKRINAALEHISSMYSHVCGQMVFVFSAEVTTRTVESFGGFVDKQMSVEAAFVVKLLITLVTMKDFVGVQDLVEFHAMHGSGLEIAAFSRAVKQSFFGMHIVVIQQDLQLGRFKGATRLHATEWRLEHVGVAQVLVQAHLSLAAVAADRTPMQVAFLFLSSSRLGTAV